MSYIWHYVSMWIVELACLFPSSPEKKNHFGIYIVIKLDV